MGFPARRMRNYLARLGWSHGDDEFFYRRHRRRTGSILDGKIRKSPAQSDLKKAGKHLCQR